MLRLEVDEENLKKQQETRKDNSKNVNDKGFTGLVSPMGLQE